ncbi:MAG: tRNA (N6-threonylcarbamoyladenosine(37)-N6)-methyltransferase TrmO [Chlorobi bacterium]|nr:tRNA (N6-threonylcarbamoyladenosine(37)-N6)-methyltransferase TrmO [Chlorobiota bacterium]
MEEIVIRPIGYVKNERKDYLIDDFWGEMVSEIILNDDIPQKALKGLEKISHLEIVFYMHKVNKKKEISYYCRPREDKKIARTGIFAQRKKERPNYIGVTIVKLLTHVDNILYVQNLDAIDGTPIIDIKPVFKEFLPTDQIEQPKWVSSLMRDYWEVSA